MYNDRILYREYIPGYGVEILILSEEPYEPFGIIPRHTTDCVLYVKEKRLFGKTIYEKQFLFRDYESCLKNYSGNIVGYHTEDDKLIIELQYTNNGIKYSPRFVVDMNTQIHRETF